jgi:Ran GTPase-activating protein (RanGAP) involved in mRNA processing and transport
MPNQERNRSLLRGVSFLTFYFNSWYRSQSGFHSASILALAESLKNTNLLSLSLSCQGIDYQGAEALSSALRSNKTLTRLNISANGVIFQNEKGAQAIFDLVNGDNALKILNLSYSEMNEDSIITLADSVKTNPRLTEFYFDGNNLKDRGISAFAEMLKESKSLKVLSLVGNNINAEGAGAFAAALRESKSLTALSLRGNKIGEQGAIVIANTLKAKSRLKKLDLYACGIGPKGVTAIASALKENQSVTSIDIGGNGRITTRYNETVNDSRWIEMTQSIVEMLQFNRNIISLGMNYLSIKNNINWEPLHNAIRLNYYLTEVIFEEYELLIPGKMNSEYFHKNGLYDILVQAHLSNNKDGLRHCYNQEYLSIADSAFQECHILPVLVNITKEYLGEPSASVPLSDMHTFFKSRRAMVQPMADKLLEPLSLYAESKRFLVLPPPHQEKARSLSLMLKSMLSDTLLVSSTLPITSRLKSLLWIERAVAAFLNIIKEPDKPYEAALNEVLSNINQHLVSSSHKVA